jgi:hypothetical protein
MKSVQGWLLTSSNHICCPKSPSLCLITYVAVFINSKFSKSSRTSQFTSATTLIETFPPKWPTPLITNSKASTNVSMKAYNSCQYAIIFHNYRAHISWHEKDTVNNFHSVYSSLSLTHSFAFLPPVYSASYLLHIIRLSWSWNKNKREFFFSVNVCYCCCW